MTGATQDVVIRPSRPADRQRLLDLLAANSRDALSEAEQESYGFVQPGLGEDTLAAMESDTGIVVAEVAGQVVGFVGTARHAAATTGPLAALLAELDYLRFNGRPVTEQRYAFYGPIVVDRAFRGKGLARLLFGGARQVLAGHADVGLLFVEDSNRHSLAVHIAGLGMDCVGGFTHAGRRFSILAFAVPAPPDAD
ncbi:GNAT family N-acetyltransferase [Goodfellowiella coeruleoviolacea]|uniref:Acetyltransferase (GNAT) family protein n=1 Tax=Goodfellowiella coeruleoviolacea TaxID=334858 RepID=A0AAE3GKH5_9PSEU|nr:GNAT family N-acetyltransferase [Goodfellowiella coeruleoviolacea]MCP2169871.1 Acetyltransferase (GNAT) family protein [Goodfellowiella coeruleoviolacea]